LNLATDQHVVIVKTNEERAGEGRRRQEKEDQRHTKGEAGQAMGTTSIDKSRRVLR
jgi:hypothetical protein